MEKKNAKKQQSKNEITYHCNGCKKDITHRTRIKCCLCPDFDLCLECFSKGLEIPPHKNNHDYRIVRDLHFPLLSETWGADEEILLLEAVEHCGMDNWLDISEFLTTKSPQECKEHYLKYYLETPMQPMPDIANSYAKQHPDCARNILHQQRKHFDIKSEKEKEKQPSHQTQNVKPKCDNHECSYNPLRKEFEFESFNNAELNIMDIKFTPEDSTEERERKFRRLERYYKMYVERKRIRDTIIRNKLFDSKKIKVNERRKGKEEHDIWLNYRPFYDCLGKEDYDKFVKAIVDINDYEKKIKQLKLWRNQGYLSMDEARNAGRGTGKKGVRVGSKAAKGVGRKGVYHH